MLSDGAVILRDGQMVPVEEVVKRLNLCEASLVTLQVAINMLPADVKEAMKAMVSASDEDGK